MNRRGFLKLGLGAAAAAVAAPLIKLLPTGYAANSSGKILEIEKALEEMWANYTIQPDTIWFDSEEARQRFLARMAELEKAEADRKTWEYPIHTLPHARHSLTVLSVDRRFTPEQKRKIRAKIYRRWPVLKLERTRELGVERNVKFRRMKKGTKI